jgi:hypothetical protein
MYVTQEMVEAAVSAMEGKKIALDRDDVRTILQAGLDDKFTPPVIHKLEDGSPDKQPGVDEELVAFLAMSAELFDWIIQKSNTQDMRLMVAANRGLQMANRLGNEHRSMFIPYSVMVDKLFKEMGSDAASLMHAAVGVAGEGGELLDAIKKHWVYNKPLDAENVLEELGDATFYMQWIINKFGWTWADVRMANRMKLAKRYPEGVYTDTHAQQRLDKQND